MSSDLDYSIPPDWSLTLGVPTNPSLDHLLFEFKVPNSTTPSPLRTPSMITSTRDTKEPSKRATTLSELSLTSVTIPPRANLGVVTSSRNSTAEARLFSQLASLNSRF